MEKRIILALGEQLFTYIQSVTMLTRTAHQPDASDLASISRVAASTDTYHCVWLNFVIFSKSSAFHVSE